MKRVVIFGNSHVSLFSGKDEIISNVPLQSFRSSNFEYILTKLGACTSYNFFWNPKYYPYIINLLNTSNFKNDYICLLLGEIDCRLHIGKNAFEKNISIEDAIEEVIDRLLICLLDLKQRGYQVLVIAVQPASNFNTPNDPERPIFGSPEDRNKITNKFNEVLSKKSKIHNFIFINFSHYLMESANICNSSYFMDYVHLRGEKVRPFFESELLKYLKNNSDS